MGSGGRRVVTSRARAERIVAVESHDPDDVPLVSKAEAIAEVRRWLEVDGIDPERIFTAMGDQVVRYKDLEFHLEQETPDGRLLRFAISRGRIMKAERRQALAHLLQIASPTPSDSRPADETGGEP
jgi:hypothetical protein